MDSIDQLPAELTEFDDKIVRKLVEKVIITEEGYEITLKNGMSKFIEK